MMKLKFLQFLIFTGFIFLLSLYFCATPKVAQASITSPYQVPSAVASGWSNILGGKNYSMTSGKDLVYDVYNSKYISGGYHIVNEDFGKGSQPYLHFDGWAVLFGYHNEDSSNNSTYIVAKKIKGSSGLGTVKIYSANDVNLSATQDLMYNNPGDGSVYNPCSNSVYNADNQLDCNMTYSDVGFAAYIPLQDLFPNQGEDAEWQLWIVKKVGGQIVATQLILPFHFGNRSYNNGTVDLTSGVNFNKLLMNSPGVLRRRYVREAAADVVNELGSNRYFSKGTTYTEEGTPDESGTAVWYGVNSSQDNPTTRWATTAYWDFGGDQAVISYDAPPKFISSTISNYRYYDGSGDYWFRPGDTGYVTLEQQDTDYNASAGVVNQNQYLRLVGSDDVRSRHDFAASTNQIDEYWTGTGNHIGIGTADELQSSAYGQVKWGFFPYLDGDSYDVQYLFRDNQGGSNGFASTGQTIDVDGLPPDIQFRNGIDTANYISQLWTTSTIQVRLKFSDGESGYKESRYAWTQSASTPSTWSSWTSNVDYIVSQSSYGAWYLHVQAEDNVGNVVTTAEGLYEHNNPPTVDFTDSPNPTDRTKNVCFANKSSDPDGNGMSYVWTWKMSTATTWNSLSSSTNPCFKFPTVGTVDVHLVGTDSHGATDTADHTITVNDLPPNAGFTATPNPTDRLTTVQFKSTATDPENDPLTFKYYYRINGTTTWTQFSTSANPTFKFPTVNTYNVEEVVTDSFGQTDSAIVNVVVNDIAPVAGFTATPNPTDRLTTVQFKSTATDAENDPLTYSYAYRVKGTTTWTQMSTSANPTFTFPAVADYEVQQTVSDNYSKSNSTIVDVVVNDLAPTAAFTTDKTLYYIMDNVKITSQSTDPENDSLTFNYKVTAPDGTLTNFTTADFSFQATQVGNYTINLVVTDPYGKSDSMTTIVPINDLTLIGHVTHTPEWTTRHQSFGDTPDEFYSGERFELSADVTDYPISYVKVTLTAPQVDGNTFNQTVELSQSTPTSWAGEMYNPSMADLSTRLANGNITFHFETLYQNGAVKTDDVTVKIIGSMLDAFKLHRWY